jgi:hypothetical protein
MATRVVFEEKKLIVTVPHKCGSTAFQAATVPGLAELSDEIDVHVGEMATRYWQKKGIGPLQFHEVFERYPDYKNLMAVRDPVSRFISTWDDFCLRTVDPNERGYDWLRGLSPKKFLDFIEKSPGSDGHWWPQYLMALPDSEYIDSRDLLDYLGLPKIRIHKGRRAKDPKLGESDLQRLRRLYRFDFELWEEAKSC